MKARIQSTMTTMPTSITSDVSIGDAREIMRSWGMRHLPIMDGVNLVGVVSERDILKALSTNKPESTEVKVVMTKDPYCVDQDASVAKVAKAMADNKYGCVIVTSGTGQVVGIFTTTDALRVLANHTDGEAMESSVSSAFSLHTEE